MTVTGGIHLGPYLAGVGVVVKVSVLVKPAATEVAAVVVVKPATAEVAIIITSEVGVGGSGGAAHAGVARDAGDARTRPQRQLGVVAQVETESIT
jgi:hypothetical protein